MSRWNGVVRRGMPAPARLHTGALPLLFHDWSHAVAVAHTRARVTGARQRVRLEKSRAWPFGVWRVREVEMAEAVAL